MKRSCSRPLRPLVIGLLWLALGLPLAGCFNPFRPLELIVGISTPPPAPNSPSNALRLLEWCYDQRAIAEYREIFDDDYRFAFAALDPYGNAYRDNPWTREDELISTTNLFQGGAANQPAATSITLNLAPEFRVRSDPRPGKNSLWHKTIRTSVSLTIVDANQLQTDVSGFAVFYLVRGDSARIPQELIDKGFGPNSSRWYIERWEDESVQPIGGAPAAARPSALGLSRSPAKAFAEAPWGEVKVRYR